MVQASTTGNLKTAINSGGGSNNPLSTVLALKAAQGLNSPAAQQARTGSIVNNQNLFDYKQYSQTRYAYDALLRLFLEQLQPSFKQKLTNLVSSEDDLGPEIILNLKWLDTYRYNQKAVYYYLDLV